MCGNGAAIGKAIIVIPCKAIPKVHLPALNVCFVVAVATISPDSVEYHADQVLALIPYLDSLALDWR